MPDYELATTAGIQVRFGQTQTLLQGAQLAWVASGTATLEAALLDTPHVVVYKTSRLTYALAKRLAQVEFIGLPNLLCRQPRLVPELIQHAVHSHPIAGRCPNSCCLSKRGVSGAENGLGRSWRHAEVGQAPVGPIRNHLKPTVGKTDQGPPPWAAPPSAPLRPSTGRLSPPAPRPNALLPCLHRKHLLRTARRSRPNPRTKEGPPQRSRWPRQVPG